MGGAVVGLQAGVEVVEAGMGGEMDSMRLMEDMDTEMGILGGEAAIAIMAATITITTAIPAAAVTGTFMAGTAAMVIIIATVPAIIMGTTAGAGIMPIIVMETAMVGGTMGIGTLAAMGRMGMKGMVDMVVVALLLHMVEGVEEAEAAEIADTDTGPGRDTAVTVLTLVVLAVLIMVGVGDGVAEAVAVGAAVEGVVDGRIMTRDMTRMLVLLKGVTIMGMEGMGDVVGMVGMDRAKVKARVEDEGEVVVVGGRGRGHMVFLCDERGFLEFGLSTPSTSPTTRSHSPTRWDTVQQ